MNASRLVRIGVGSGLILGGLYLGLYLAGPQIGERFPPMVDHMPLDEMAIDCSPHRSDSEHRTVTVTMTNEDETDSFEFTFRHVNKGDFEPITSCDSSKIVQAGESVSVTCQVSEAELEDKGRNIWVWAVASQSKEIFGGLPNSYQAYCWLSDRAKLADVGWAALPTLVIAAGIFLMFWGFRSGKTVQN